jgi:hypothetical protein
MTETIEQILQAAIILLGFSAGGFWVLSVETRIRSLIELLVDLKRK